MFGSVVLDVAIGLMLLFLFASLICAAMREAIETLVNARSADLEQGLRDMLDAPDTHANTEALFAHPLIYPLYRGTYRPSRLRASRSLVGGVPSRRMSLSGRTNLPSFIPAHAFARAFLDLQARGPLGDAGQPAPPLTPEALRARAEAMPDNAQRRVLLVALDEGGDDLHAVERAIVAWFEGCMAQLSRLYKSHTQRMLFLIGLATAVALNIDAYSVGRALFQDGALRAAAVAQATVLVSPGHTAPDGDVAHAVAAYDALSGELGQIRFPTGWSRPLPQHLDTPGHVLQALVGWIITAFAVMLGAPFWFDLLGRFVSVRQQAQPDGR
ncbi:hypothetical protein NFI95_03760 [Acetobacteraceae bacterium KSS8]|uniref:Uncharacterized protein n=1 Tax=Endosaccharibacter trunci TaxID=2812733 RepID=A0ABT1W3W9_9PROT|nr:hypothetical protein [Acetobacteraceae bacterium KSS8]